MGDFRRRGRIYGRSQSHQKLSFKRKDGKKSDMVLREQVCSKKLCGKVSTHGRVKRGHVKKKISENLVGKDGGLTGTKRPNRLGIVRKKREASVKMKPSELSLPLRRWKED